MTVRSDGPSSGGLVFMFYAASSISMVSSGVSGAFSQGTVVGCRL